MRRLLVLHAIEHARGRWKVLPQTFGIVGIHPLILFFQRNREGENFTFGKTIKISHTCLQNYNGRRYCMNRSRTALAAATSGVTTRIVSSPAMVPTISGHSS